MSLPSSIFHKRLGQQVRRGRRKPSIHTCYAMDRACHHPKQSKKHSPHRGPIHFVPGYSNDTLLECQWRWPHRRCPHNCSGTPQRANSTHQCCHTTRIGCNTGCSGRFCHWLAYHIVRLMNRQLETRVLPIRKSKAYPF